MNRRQTMAENRRLVEENAALAAKLIKVEAHASLAVARLAAAIEQRSRMILELESCKADAEIEEQEAVNARVLLANYRSLAHQVRQLAADAWMDGDAVDPSVLRDQVVGFERSISNDVASEMNCDDDGRISQEWRRVVEQRVIKDSAVTYPEIAMVAAHEPEAVLEFRKGVESGVKTREAIDKMAAQVSGWAAGFTGKATPADQPGRFNHAFTPRSVADQLIEEHAEPRGHAYAYDDYGGSDEPDDLPY